MQVMSSLTHHPAINNHIKAMEKEHTVRCIDSTPTPTKDRQREREQKKCHNAQIHNPAGLAPAVKIATIEEKEIKCKGG